MSRCTLTRLALGAVMLAGIAGATLLTGTTQVAAQEQAMRPPLLFEETWQQNDAQMGVPTSPHRSAPEYHLAGPTAVTNPNLTLQLYGEKVHDVTVYEHEGRTDLWTGLAGSPVAITLKDRRNFLDLTGLARMQAIVRTNNLHVLHPVVRLADGTLLVGSQAIDTNGAFLTVSVAFDNQNWFVLDPTEVSVSNSVDDVDLSRVDEVGFANLAPGGGHGNSGWSNISTFQVYARGVGR